MQEALTNVVKHSRATTVSIVLARKGASVTAVIEDDGVGFTPDAPAEGLGLVGMRERIALRRRPADDRVAPAEQGTTPSWPRCRC